MVNSGPLVDRWGEGYFLGLDFSQNNFEGLTSVKVGLDPSAGSGLVELLGDPDLNGVFKITDKEHQKFVVEQTDGVFTLRQEWELFALELLEPEPIAPITSLAVPSSVTNVYGNGFQAANIQDNVAFTYNSETNNFTASGLLRRQSSGPIVQETEKRGWYIVFDMSQFNSTFAESTDIHNIDIEIRATLGGYDTRVDFCEYVIEEGSQSPMIDPYVTLCVNDEFEGVSRAIITQVRADGEYLEQEIDLSSLVLNN